VRATGSRTSTFSENDRGVPGTGSVAWDAAFDALLDIGYDGWLTVEAFGNFLPNLAAATKIWRPLFESEEKLAVDAHAFLSAKLRGVKQLGLRLVLGLTLRSPIQNGPRSCWACKIMLR